MKTLILNATDLTGKRLDLLVEDGVLTASRPVGSMAAGAGAEVIDAAGYLLMPPLVDAHTHLDKNLLDMDWFVNSVGHRLMDRIDNERVSRRKLGLDTRVQAERLIRRSLGLGTLYMRSHVDVDTENGLSCLEGVLEAREAYKDLLGIELVAFPQSGLTSSPGAYELMERALELGADLVGGVDPAGVDRDPKGGVDAIFRLAEKYGRGVDIHLHEPGHLGGFTLELIAAHTVASGMQGKVTVSHALCLGDSDRALVAGLTKTLAASGVQIVTSAQPNLPTAPSVRELTAAGVNIAGGNDNIRDMWAPYGTGDMLERSQIIALRNDFHQDDELELALRVCTVHGARLMNLADYGIKPGGKADFLLVKARCAAECVAANPRERMVFKSGKLIAKDGVLL